MKTALVVIFALLLAGCTESRTEPYGHFTAIDKEWTDEEVKTAQIADYGNRTLPKPEYENRTTGLPRNTLHIGVEILDILNGMKSYY